MIDKHDPLPLYHQVKQTLKDRIGRQIYPVGTPIPTELELSEQFGVSRITIRRALDELAAEGLLQKQQGRGTFVQQPRVTQELNQITCWTEAIQAQGLRPRTARMKCVRERANAEIAGLLGVSTDQEVVRIERLRYGGKEPVSLMTNYLLAYLVPNLEEDGLDHESLYHVLEERYHIKFGKAMELVQAREADAAEAKALKIEPGSPVLCVRRVTLDPNDVPFEVVYVTSRADKYQYAVTLICRPR